MTVLAERVWASPPYEHGGDSHRGWRVLVGGWASGVSSG